MAKKFTKLTIGEVVPTTEEATVTPSPATQIITPTNADYLSKVTVKPIPSEYEIPTYFEASEVVVS